MASFVEYAGNSENRMCFDKDWTSSSDTLGLVDGGVCLVLDLLAIVTATSKKEHAAFESFCPSPLSL